MRFFKSILYCSLSLAALSFAFGFWMIATEAASTLHHATLTADALAEVPTLLNARVTALQSSVEKLPNQVLPPVLARVDAATEKVDAQLTALRTETLATSKEFLEVADGRLASIQAKLEPVLINAASIEAHADKTVVDLHPQLLGLVAASKVTMGQTAQTMREVERATPALLQDAQGIGRSVDGIAADVHAATTDFVKPRTGWQKFKAWLEMAGKVGARFL